MHIEVGVYICITSISGSVTYTNVENLQMNTMYYFKLRAATNAGQGPSTDVIKIRTPNKNGPYANGSKIKNIFSFKRHAGVTAIMWLTISVAQGLADSSSKNPRTSSQIININE